MYYIYQKEDNTACVTTKPFDMPLINLTEDEVKAEQYLKKYLLIGRNHIRRYLDGNGNKYHYGYVIGKYDNETLKCIECVEYEDNFNTSDCGLKINLSTDMFSLLVNKSIKSDKINVEELEKETNGFKDTDILIWWHENLHHGSPISTHRIDVSIVNIANSLISQNVQNIYIQHQLECFIEDYKSYGEETDFQDMLAVIKRISEDDYDICDFQLEEIPHESVYCFKNRNKNEYFDVYINHFNGSENFATVGYVGEDGCTHDAPCIKEALYQMEE